MEQQSPVGNPFAAASRNGFSARAKPEDAVDLLARELGGISNGTATGANGQQKKFTSLKPSFSAYGQLEPAASSSARTLQTETSGSLGAPRKDMAFMRSHSQKAAARESSSADFSAVPGWNAFEQSKSPLSWPPASPLKAPRKPTEDAVDVDGVSREAVNAWFAEADAKRTGLLASRDAVAFFGRTGLPTKTLSKIWNTVKAVSAEQAEGLNRAQFSMALRLVALAQSGRELTDDLARVAVDPDSWKARGKSPLPAPKLGPLRRSGSSVGAAADLATKPERTRSRSEGVHALKLADLAGEPVPDSRPSQFGARSPQPFPAMPETQPLAAQKTGSRSLDTLSPICIEARLPPLHPKKCSRLSLLAAGHGSLFAGPSSAGGILQWGKPEDVIQRPLIDPDTLSEDIVISERSFAALNEDPDVAKACETMFPEAKSVTCLHVDDTNSVLWVGHEDGRISAFTLGPSSGSPINTKRIHHWQAYRGGKVMAICTTAWGDVWVGSSRGCIRVWRVETLASGVNSVSLPRELRRQGGGRASSNSIMFLAVPQSGQVVWSGSQKTLSIWDAHLGTYLGQVQRGTDNDVDRENTRKLLENSERDPRFISPLPINPLKGLDIDRMNGKIATKASTSVKREAIIAEQEAWAVQTDKKHGAEWVENVGALGGKAIDKTGKAAVHAGKLIGKLMRNKKKGDVSSSESRGARQLGVRTRSEILPDHGDQSGDDPTEDEAAGERGAGKDGQLRALVADNSNGVWAAWQSGKMERYYYNGLWKASKDMGSPICSLAVIGQRLWAALADGRIRVLAEKVPPREWRAHECGVLQLAVAGSRVYSLGADGSIRGWCSTVPSEHDLAARAALDKAADSLVERKELEMLCFSWNVNEQKPSHSAFFRTVTRLANSESIQLVMFALQEIEMGGGSVAMAAAKDALHKKAQEKGNNNGQWWASQLLMALGGPNMWRQFGLRQLSGMLVLVFARSELEGRIGEVSTASVACGVLGVGGNKGAVAVSFTLFRRRIACVCSHFAAHQDAVWARNQNYSTIVKGLTFSKLPWFDLQVYPDEEDHIHKSAHRLADSLLDSASDTDLQNEIEPALIQGQGMRAAEMLIWAGDFNYRVDCSYEEAKDSIRRGRLEQMLLKDQCKAEMRQGRVFQHMREGTIRFPPTYKFNKNDSDPLGYDTSEKRRVPAWTDRIFFRGTLRKDIPEDETASPSLLDGFEPEENPARAGRVEAITVEAADYSACMDVYDSDHKPIFSRLRVLLPVTLQERKRRECSNLLRECWKSGKPADPKVELSAELVTLHPIEERSQLLTVSNTGSSAAVFRVVPLVQPWQRPPTDAPREVPEWLDISPLCARIPAQGSLSVWVGLRAAESTWASKERVAQLRLRVDHDFAAGGERPALAEHRDRVFTVKCNMSHRH